MTEKLTLGSDHEKFNIIKYISAHRNEPRLLVTLKFMAGIITSQKNTKDEDEALNDFWNAMVCNVEGNIEFSMK